MLNVLGREMVEIGVELKRKLENMHYEVVGRHTALKLTAKV